MIVNNIFKAIGEFCQTILFQPFNALRSMDNWWVQSTVSWIFVIITLIAFFYWLGELRKYGKSGNE